MSDTVDPAAHWDTVYRTRAVDAVSWYQRYPTTSLELIGRVLPPGGSVLDVGAGASNLVDELSGDHPVTLLDVSAVALGKVVQRLDGRARVDTVVADICAWSPPRTWDVWHDRAVFHFLTDPADQAAYRSALHAALAPGGHAIVATFALDGPERCSGLPTARYDDDGLHAVLGGDAFERVDTRHQLHTRPDGEVQAFQWVVLRRR